MRTRKRKSNLNKKRDTLNKNLRDTARKGASFVPGIGLILSINDTAKSASKTVRSAQDYGSELYKETKRKMQRRNPFR